MCHGKGRTEKNAEASRLSGNNYICVYILLWMALSLGPTFGVLLHERTGRYSVLDLFKHVMLMARNNNLVSFLDPLYTIKT